MNPQNAIMGVANLTGKKIASNGIAINASPNPKVDLTKAAIKIIIRNNVNSIKSKC